MNLGSTYLNILIETTGWAILIAILLTVAIRLLKKTRFLSLSIVFLTLCVVLTIAGSELFLQRNFAARHRAQNIWVPQEGCITYRPNPIALFATYAMSEETFENWALSHPWKLSLHELSDRPLIDDSECLGFLDPKLAYATEMSSSGRQLRAYFKDGVMYLSYSAM